MAGTKQQQMTTGALIFARNNEHTDYVAMAHWSARNIKRHLGIETHIVTDESRTDSGSRHFNDVGKATWHNTNRMDAYRLSPWDRTLVLDADYVVASDQLRGVLDCDVDFLAHRWAYDVTGCNDFKGLNYFGETHMPMWWATVMIFNKSKQAEMIFDTMAMIRDNWTHYRNIYKNNTPTYRNDHALTIAMLVVNGHTLAHCEIPWRLASAMPDHKLTQLNQDRYRVEFQNGQGQSRWIELRQDFHAMGKSQLGEIVASNS
jgi:hypothetical protein